MITNACKSNKFILREKFGRVWLVLFSSNLKTERTLALDLSPKINLIHGEKKF